MIAVIDTNVLVSGLINPAGPPGRLTDWLRAGTLEPAVDDRLLAEYATVLRRDYFLRYFTETEREDVLRYLHAGAHAFEVHTLVAGLPDPHDACFLEVAIEANAPLVTGNLRHFPAKLRHGANVFSPAEFVAYAAPKLRRHS